MKKAYFAGVALLIIALGLLLVKQGKLSFSPASRTATQPEPVAPVSLTQEGAPGKQKQPLADLDVRLQAKGAEPVLSASRVRETAEFKKSLPGAAVSFDPITKSPKWIGSNAQLLTGPQAELAAKDADAPVRQFIEAHRVLFGHGPEVLNRARRVTDYSTARGPSRKVVWHQQLDGIDVFEAILQANLTTHSALINIGSQMMPEPEACLDAATRTALASNPPVTVEQAVAAAGASVGENITADGVKPMGPPKAQPDRRQQFRATMLTDAEASLVWVPMDEKTLRLAWDVTLTSRSRSEMYRVLVDVQNAGVLVRQGLTSYISPATYRVFTKESPTPFSPGHETPSSLQPPVINRELVTLSALDTTASPNGWINDADNITTGNNTDTYTDVDNSNTPDLPRTTGSPNRVFDFPLNLTQAPSGFKDASNTQLFYWTNFIHDRLYQLGFTEAAGNFQLDNFGRGGVANDPVNAEAQDGSGTDNANFSTPVDGGRGRMQMYLWTSATPDRDGSYEAEVVLHEYAHGLSNRLVGGPSVTITSLSSRGMGEGWSDFYGLALTAEATDNPHGNWARGGWSRYQFSGWLSENYYYGARRYSYSTDMLKNPHTLRDIDPNQVDWHTSVPRNPTYASTQDATQVHYQGTVWCATLWDLRANFILKHGFAVGNERALFLVTEGMKYGPANPNFIESRDGILQATLVNHPQDLGEVWTAFAKRGMGQGATAPVSTTTTGIVESYSVPDSLEINDRSGWNIQGNSSGPLLPASKTLTLSNDGATSINWTASPGVMWLSVSPASGTLAAGGNVTVTVSPLAAQAPIGFNSTNLVFTNSATGFKQPVGIRLYVAPPVAHTFDLSTSPGWTTSGEWAWGTPTGSGGAAAGGAGNPDPSSGATGPAVYGVNLSGNVSPATGGPYYLTSTPVNLSIRKNTRLRFMRWLNGNTLSYHRLTVQVSTDGSNWREVFVNPGTAMADNAWTLLDYDISSIADRQSAVQVRWGYENLGTTSSYSGWNIDDIQFLGEPVAQFDLNFASSTNEAAGTVAATLEMNVPLDTPLTVSLASSDPTAATVPATVIIPPGSMSVPFAITVVDDAILDGSQPAVITASAPNYLTSLRTLAVHDNETATLTVTLPATVVEGAPNLIGSLTVSAAPGRDVAVALSSSNPALSVPATVTLPAGSTAAVPFALSAPDNLYAEGSKMATVTASVNQWTSGVQNVQVTDDEAPTILLTGPSSVREGDAVQTYTVTVNTLQTSDLILDLSSDDLSEMTVPASVTVLAGQFSATFQGTIFNDSIKDGSQVATLTCSRAGYLSGARAVSVADNEVHSYGFAAIPVLQKRSKPFVITVTARDIQGATITNHTGGITFSSNSATGPVPFTPSATSLFVQGMVAELVTVSAAATGVTLSAADGAGNTGTSNAFNVEAVPHDRFVWSGLPGTAITPDTPFGGTVTAVDDQGATTTTYESPTTVDVWLPLLDMTVGSGLLTTPKVYNTAAHDSRAQMIITSAELGSRPRWIGVIAFIPGSAGGNAMSNVTLRMKHTDRADFTSAASWETSGWQTVYSSSSLAASTSTLLFDQPFFYDGTRNVMLDFSFNGSSSTTAGQLRYTARTGRLLSGTSQSLHGDPLLWSDTTGPIFSISGEVPIITFYEARNFGAIPASPVAPVAGVWSGQAYLPATSASTSFWLRALAPTGVTGFSSRLTLGTATTAGTPGSSTLFSDGFETGILGTAWNTADSAGAVPRTRVLSSNTPKTGSYHMVMDDGNSVDGTFARNSPTLSLNLAGRRNVSLEWYAKSFLDVGHAPTLTGPFGTFDSSMNYDGVAVSQDGITWVEVSALRGLPSSYGTTPAQVMLDPVIQRLGWSFNSSFRIRFSQYGDLGISSNGIGLDDVAVRADPANAISLSLPATLAEGAVNVPFTITLPTVAAADVSVSLTCTPSTRLTAPAVVVIPAGQSSASSSISAPQNFYTEAGIAATVTAQATGYATSTTHVFIADDEVFTLGLVLPAQITEGGSNATGTLTISPPPTTAINAYFQMAGSQAAPSSMHVTFSPGAASTTFTIIATDDVLMDGTQTETFTAGGAGMISTTVTLDVLDNETLALALSLPASLAEGGSPGVGTAAISGVRGVNTTVNLSSLDVSEATVPASVVIPAGQTSVNFQITPVEDSLQDGTQNVMITATTSGFTDGSGTLSVRDNDPNSFDFSSIPSPQTRNKPFALTITAEDGNGQTLPDFNGTVTLTASGGLSVSTSTPLTFTQGVWSGQVQIAGTGTGVVLNIIGGSGATGSSNAFDVNMGGAATALAFAPLPSVISAGSVLPVQIMAVDANGVLVSEASGPVTVQLRTSPGNAVVVTTSATLVAGKATLSGFTMPSTATAVYLGATAGALSGQSPVFAITLPPPLIRPVGNGEEVVFQDGFETGLLPAWTLTGTNTHRTLISTANTPRTGTGHLVMDSSVDGTYSRNEATLTLDLAGRTDVELSFWMKEFSDEDNSPPSSPFSTGADFDGVAISTNGGATWYEVQGLRSANGISSTYTQFTIDISAAAASLGLTLNTAFKIRLNHYDDFAVSTDGFAFDDVEVRANKLQGAEPVVTVFQEDFESGVFRPEWQVSGSPLHRTVISPTQGPRGARHLLMDAHSVAPARNEATLSLDLTGLQDLTLQFWMKEFGDEDHGPPAAPFTNSANFDGVAISADGVSWHEVKGLRTADTISAAYLQFTVDLSAAAASRGLTFGPGFKIRFNHYDDEPLTADGFAFDDILLTARHVATLAFTVPASVNEGSSTSASVSLPATRGQDTLVHLANNLPGRLVMPATVTIPAGQLSASFNLSVTDDSVLQGSFNAEMTAVAEGLSRALATVVVRDNENVTGFDLQLSGTTLTEGGSLNGTVSYTGGSALDFSVLLSATPGIGLTYPASLTLPQGTTSAAFTLAKPENSLLLEPSSTVLAAGAALATDSITVTLTDNDAAQPLVITLPDSVWESAAPVTGTVGFVVPKAPGVDVVVTLGNSNSGALTTPANVTIPAGSSTVSFTATPQGNSLFDGTRNVVLTASASDVTGDTHNIAVLDDELHHLTIDTIPSPQVISRPFSVTLRATSIDGVTIPSFNGQATLAAASGGSPVSMSASSTPTLVNGVWSGDLLFPSPTTQVVVTATSGSLTGTSNAFNVTTGPRLSISPASLNVTAPAGESRAEKTLTLSNPGESTLTWDSEVVIDGAVAVPTLETVQTNLNNGYASINSLIPSRFDFSDGVTGTNISDGGNDMYDGGNYLTTNLFSAGTYVSYSDNVIATNAGFGTGGRYFTRKYPGLFVMAADMVGVDYFDISGNLGHDGAGTADATILTSQRGSVTYKGFVKRVYSSKPSVNHLIIIADNGLATRTFSTDTNNDAHRVSGLTGVTRLYHLLYSSYGTGGYITDAQTQSIMEAFLNTLPLTPWCSLEPKSGTIPAGGSSVVSAVFNTQQLAAGSQSTATLRLTSDDPTAPQQDVPVTLTVAPGVANFGWATIASPQRANVPFAATVTARDTNGNTVTSFNGTASITAGPQTQNVTGTGTSANAFPFYTTYYENRMQSIYLPSEVGAAGRISGLEIQTSSTAGAMSNFTVRVKHTTKSSYSATDWENSGWTLLYQNTLTISASGWVVLPVSGVFDYDGTRNLMVDISFDNVSSAYPTGTGTHTNTAGSRSIYAGTYGSNGDPLLWQGTSPSANIASFVPNLRFTKLPAASASPTSVVFTSGVWSGNAALSATGASLALQAQHATRPSVTGLSNLFAVTSAGTLAITAAASGTEGGTINATVTTSTAPASNLTVSLVSTDTTEATVPAAVTILAGQTSASFTITLVDDPLLDGLQTAAVQATAPDYSLTTHTLAVADNETTTVTLILPAALNESSTATGTVQLGMTATTEMTVLLASNLTSRLTVPASVVIPAGQNSATFTLTAPNTSAIDGTQTATITATLAGSTPGTATVDVIDNESRNLAVIMNYTSLSEGGAAQTNAGYVSLSGTVTAPLVISLASSDTTEASVPATVTISTGSSTGYFTVTPVNDALYDGSQSVTISASAATYTNGTGTVTITDDDVHHFGFGTITSQVRNKPFNITVTAQDINNIGITTYRGSPVLSAAQGGTPLAMTPANTGAFTTSSRTVAVNVTNDATAAVITATDAAINATGSSNSFAISHGSLNKFLWNAIGSVQAEVPFSATLTAQDDVGNTVTSFSGTAALDALPEVTIGTASTTSTQPFFTSAYENRQQVIYTAAEVGSARSITGLALNVTSIPPLAMGSFTIRMKHVTKSDYSAGASWESTGWTTCFAASRTVSSSGWHTIPFTTSFAYNGTDNLMVDFSFNNSTISSNGSVSAFTSAATQNMYNYSFVDNALGAPTSWSGTAVSSFTSTTRPVIRLSAAGPPVSPAATTAFTNGVWSGNVTVGSQASNVLLRATSGSATGLSNTFNVSAPPLRLILNLPSSAAENAGTITGTLAVNVMQPSALTVNLSSNDTSEATVPATVVIPANTLSVPVTVTLVNDSLTDGAQTAVITATLPSIHTTTASVIVLDDELHNFQFATITGPKIRNGVFSVTLTARSIDGLTLTGYAGTPVLSASEGGSPLVMTTPTGPLTGFTSGSKTFNVTLDAFATAAVLTATDGATSGSSNSFVVGSGPHTRFAWSTIASPQMAGVPFQVTLNAHDDYGNLVISYNGSASLSLLAPPGPAVTPTATGNFANGVWTGNITLATPSTGQISLKAVSGVVSSASNAFTVQPPPPQMTLTLPASVSESAGTVNGTLTFDFAQPTAHLINLSSSDTTAAQVPATVTMPAFSSSIPVTLTVVGDSIKDGAQTATITATIPSVHTTNASISVLDDELHDFALASIPSPQVKDALLTVAVTARSIDGLAVTTYSGTPVMSIKDGGTTLPFTQQDTLTSFVNGIKSLNIAVGAAGSQAVITVTDGAATGSSNPFAVEAVGPAARLVWSTVPSPQFAGEDAPVTLQVQDAHGKTITGFNGQVSLAPERPVAVGQNNNVNEHPISTTYARARSQQVILASEIGGGGTLESLTLNIADPGAVSTLTDFTIRMKHTARASYTGAPADASWEPSGFTTVYQGSPEISGPGQITFRFQNGFNYDGVSHLMIDYSHRDSSAAGSIGPRFTSTTNGTYRSIQFGTNSTLNGDPLTWSGTAPAAQSEVRTTDIRLGFAMSVSVSPASVTVSGGTWSGSLKAGAAAAPLAVRASAGGNLHGVTNAFEVLGGHHVFNPEPAFTKGLTNTLEWAPVSAGLQYQVQRATTPDFAAPVNSSFSTSTQSLQTSLTDGQLYYYRLRMRRLGSLAWTSDWSPTVSSTQDNTAPVVQSFTSSIVSANGFILGSATDSSGIQQVTVGASQATTTDQFNPWKGLVTGLVPGANTVTITASDNAVPPNTRTISAVIVRTHSDTPMAPSFHADPESQWLIPGQAARFSPVIVGSRPMRYQWIKDGKTIRTGGAEYLIPAIKTADAGVYRLVAQNDASPNVVSSQDFYLVPLTALQDITVKDGGSFKQSTTVTPPKGTTVSCLWWLADTVVNDGPRSSGAVVSGATKSSLSISRITAAEQGTWTLRMQLVSAGRVVSSAEKSFQVRVLREKPVLAALPSPMEVWVSEPVDFTLSATASPTSYAATGLPAGLVLDKVTGRVTGRLTTPSKVDAKTGQPVPAVIKFTATNPVGTSLPVELRLVVKDHFGPLAGTFQGLVDRNAVTNFNHGGLADFTLAKTGIATGSFTLAGQRHSFVTPVTPLNGGDNTPGIELGQMNFRVSRAKPSALGDLSVALTLASAGGDGSLDDLVFAPAGVLHVYGDGTAGTDNSAANGANTARFNQPTGMVLDDEGIVIVADTANNRLRVLTPADGLRCQVSTFTAGSITAPEAVLPANGQGYYVAGNAAIQLFRGTGIPELLVGSPGLPGHQDGVGSAARFRLPCGLCIDPAGNLYVTDRGSHVIRKITPGGMVTTLAGKADTPGHADGSGNKALFHSPRGIIYDAVSKTLLVADTENAVIRRVTLAGAVTTWIGSGRVPGDAPGIGTLARLNRPAGIASDEAGGCYVTDGGIWQIKASGLAVRIHRSASAAETDLPQGIMFDSGARRLIVTYPAGHRIEEYQIPILEAPRSDSPFSVFRTPLATGIPAGLFNISLTPEGGTSPRPQGYGHASLKVSTTAAVSLSGRLPDGQTWTASGALAADRRFATHAMLYKGTGSLLGTFEISAGGTLIDEEPLTWLKLPQPLVPADMSYPAGFDLALVPAGGLYVPGNLHTYLGLSGSPASLGFHASSLGSLTDFSHGFTLAAPNTIKLNASNPQALSLKIDPATGLVSGKFQTGSPARSASFSGLIINDEGKQGRGHFLLPESTAKDARIESGIFTITPP